MTPETEHLWSELERFAFDELGARITFVARLARENRWSRGYAARVFREYKRFLVVAATVDHAVAPSDPVDQAWHLHLLDTRSYWGDLCPNVLGKSLHHIPSRGRDDEVPLLRAQYERTLRSYVEIFGESPPPDIWANPDRPCVPKISLTRIAAAMRSHLLATRSAFFGCLFAGLVVVGCGIATSPFDLPGPKFLVVYCILWMSSIAVAFLARRWLVRAWGREVPADPKLDPYEVAYLADGERGAIQAVLAYLLAKRCVSYDSGAMAFAVADAPLERAGAFEQAVYEGVKRGLPGHHLRVADLVEQSKVHTNVIFAHLESMGLMVRRSFLPLGVAVSVIAFGAIKIVVGATREKPVGVLVLLCFVTLWTAFALFRPRRSLTAAGHARLATLKANNAALSKERISQKQAADPGSLALGVALFGLPVLAAADILDIDIVLPKLTADLKGAFRGPPGDDDSSCSGASSCSGGDGSGGGGCGGCGGGD